MPVSFFQKSQNVGIKLWWLLEKNQYERKVEVLSLNPLRPEWPAKQSSQNFRRNNLFETVHSDEHDSWDTETKGHCFYNEALHSQLKESDPLLIWVYMFSAVLSLKQKRSTYWYRGTHWNKKHYWIGALINQNKIQGDAYWGGGAN